MLTLIQNRYNCNRYNNVACNRYRQQCPAFKSNILLKTAKSSEKGALNIEFVGRKVINFITGLVTKKKMDRIYNDLNSVKKESSEFMGMLSNVGRFFCQW